MIALVITLATTRHRVETPVMGEFGYRLSLELPASWTIKFDPGSRPVRYRELDGKVLQGARTVCRIALFQWSFSRAKTLHLLKQKVKLGHAVAYQTTDEYGSWLSIPEPGADLCFCLRASEFSSATNRRLWRAEIRRARIERPDTK